MQIAFGRVRRKTSPAGMERFAFLGLPQTRFGKKADASDSASETVKREVVEARGPRRTDACCVSPISIEMSICF